MIYGIGETVFDIVFDHSQRPVSGCPGGSVFNSMISIGRSGKHGAFIGEVGDDQIGELTRQFLRSNGIDDSCVVTNRGNKSHLSIAFLDEEAKAHYTFYKDYQAQMLDFATPRFAEGDFFLFGSYFVLNARLRARTAQTIEAAKRGRATLLYDINFRASHASEAETVRETIRGNMRIADIVKASNEDIHNAFGTEDWREVYHKEIGRCCEYFICTEGSKGATLIWSGGELHVAAQKLTPVNTIGAGDSFNAGLVCGLEEGGFVPKEMAADKERAAEQIAAAMENGVRFASEVCLSSDNYIASPQERAQSIKD